MSSPGNVTELNKLESVRGKISRPDYHFVRSCLLLDRYKCAAHKKSMRHYLDLAK